MRSTKLAGQPSTVVSLAAAVILTAVNYVAGFRPGTGSGTGSESGNAANAYDIFYRGGDHPCEDSSDNKKGHDAIVPL